MATLLKYSLTDGQIAGLWRADSEALLSAQIVEDDPDFGYLLSDLLQGATDLQDRYYVIGGAVFAKTELTLSATPSPFAADGVTECTVSVTPFVECTLRVNGTSHALTVGDETLVITTDTPQTFTITLEPMGAYWAAGITAEAT